MLTEKMQRYLRNLGADHFWAQRPADNPTCRALQRRGLLDGEYTSKDKWGVGCLWCWRVTDAGRAELNKGSNAHVAEPFRSILNNFASGR